MIISYRTIDEKEWFVLKKKLQDRYELSDLGRAQHILGMRITQFKDKTFQLDQQLYVSDKVKQFMTDDCKSARTPEEKNR